MRFGILLSPGTHVPTQVAAAEANGFAAAHFLDSPMIFGDPYVAMAVAARETSSIGLATGVTNPISRSLPIVASSFASLNALAPGRLALGIGVGFTATLALGDRRAKIAELEDFIRGFRSLMRGEVTECSVREGAVRAKFLNQGAPWFDQESSIPVTVAAMRPRGLRLAGALADTVLLGGITEPAIIAHCRRFVDEAAEAAGRSPSDVGLAVTPSTFITEQEPSRAELVGALGPKSLAPAALFSAVAAEAPGTPRELVDDMAAARAAAYAAKEDGARESRDGHLRAFSDYMTKLKPDQVDLVTDSVLRATAVSGTPGQSIAAIREIEAAGVDEVILSPLPQLVERTIELYGTHVIPAWGPVSGAADLRAAR